VAAQVAVGRKSSETTATPALPDLLLDPRADSDDGRDARAAEDGEGRDIPRGAIPHRPQGQSREADDFLPAGGRAGPSRGTPRPASRPRPGPPPRLGSREPDAPHSTSSGRDPIIAGSPGPRQPHCARPSADIALHRSNREGLDRWNVHRVQLNSDPRNGAALAGPREVPSGNWPTHEASWGRTMGGAAWAAGIRARATISI